ncbi:DUF1015 family protein [Amycolatopsis acidicola]|uniref:DUF1015 family protein n=1 Tax=Amycolatopsis acidicola TaxID=2596893 RepID=A0A5N0V4P0_9PSEU|nr:DUF1015 family protein [Amycolatopsis acidicola]KAA9161387.1 DUF1015 family protein [Amycolatopsis acidicola]
MNQSAHAIRTGWVVVGDVPGPNVDEFAEPSEVVDALAGTRGETLLAVQHPHRTPRARARGLSLAQALPEARRTLDRLLATHYREAHDFVAAYRVDGAVGVFCLVDPAQGVRHSEEIYPRIVDERAAMLDGLGRATSAAMLVPLRDGPALTESVERAVAGQKPDVVSGGHRLWLIGPGPVQEELLALVRRGPLLVADGNHRVAAARSSLLALVTAGPELRIGAIHRALVGTGLRTGQLAAAWRRAGLVVRETRAPEPPAKPGLVTVPSGLVVELPEPREPLPRIDHDVVERLLIGQALGIDPEGPHVRALPAGHPPGPDVDAVLQLAPVPFADVLAVHEQGRRMPRKSTYFTPKPRSGLLIAELPAPKS